MRSIVGRFLEHSRIFCFENGGEPKIYLGSADWMPRNLFRRVETVFPVVTPGMKEHVDEILEWFWRDNVKAKVMQPDGIYKLRETNEAPFDAQAEFIAEAQRRRKKRMAAVASSSQLKRSIRLSRGWLSHGGMALALHEVCIGLPFAHDVRLASHQQEFRAGAAGSCRSMT